MTLETLHAIVQANFACKNKGQLILSADVIEGNFQLPMMFFCALAGELGHSAEETSLFLDTGQTEVTQHIARFEHLDLNADITEDTRLNRKLALIQNGIRLHALGVKAETYFNQILRRQ